MCFLMIVGFLVLNMVVGIVVSNYQLCQEKQENADKKLKSPKTKNPLVIVDKTYYGKNKSCFILDNCAFVLLHISQKRASCIRTVNTLQQTC